MPEVIIVKDQDEAGELYARCVADLIRASRTRCWVWRPVRARWPPTVTSPPW